MQSVVQHGITKLNRYYFHFVLILSFSMFSVSQHLHFECWLLQLPPFFQKPHMLEEYENLAERNQEIGNTLISLYTDKAGGILTEKCFLKLTDENKKYFLLNNSMKNYPIPI